MNGDPNAPAPVTLVGIGPILALTIRAEIGDLTRVADGPHLASDAGVVPLVKSSAGRTWRAAITRQGSPRLRGAPGEAAVQAITRSIRRAGERADWRCGRVG